MESYKALPIKFKIYAKDEAEAERGRQSIVQFINILGQHGAMVSGDKLAVAVEQMGGNTFIVSQIIQFFLKK